MRILVSFRDIPHLAKESLMPDHHEEQGLHPRGSAVPFPVPLALLCIENAVLCAICCAVSC